MSRLSGKRSSTEASELQHAKHSKNATRKDRAQTEPLKSPAKDTKDTNVVRGDDRPQAVRRSA